MLRDTLGNKNDSNYYYTVTIEMYVNLKLLDNFGLVKIFED
jgi:hypothetical protein